jgi:hypothetical protein
VDADPARQLTEIDRGPEGPGRVPLLAEPVASRRGFIKAGLAAGPIVLSVTNRAAWAKDKDKKDKDDKGRRKDGLTESAAASSTHLSHHPRRA